MNLVHPRSKKVLMEEYPMHRAAENGDVEYVKRLIESGMSVGSLDKDKHTPLHRAARCGHLKVVEFLIGQKCDLDLKAENGSTAVLLAAECGHMTMVELLLQSGADGNCVSGIGNWAVLHHASRRGWTDTVKLLVKNRNTKLNAKTTLGTTPLLLAAREGHTDVVELLIEAGAKVDCHDADLWTVLDYASKRGWLHIVKKVVEKRECDVDTRNSYGMNPLLLAAYEGHTDIVELLIDAGAYVYIKDNNSGTVLHYASKKGWLQIVTKILKINNSLINSKNDQGNTPLHLACSMHNTDIVQELLEAGADASIENYNGEGAFFGETIHSAAGTGDVQKLEKFIQLGVSIESQDYMGYTPLHHAARSNNLIAAKFLIDNNCNLNPKSHDNDTPLLVASFYEDAEELVDLLVRAGADINCCTADAGITFLHNACLNGWKDIVKCILEKGNIDVDVKAGDGLTPLMYAVEEGSVDVTKLLLQAGANIHACDEQGKAALHFAFQCHREQDVVVEMVKTLLLAGADANLKNCNNETAFHLAVEYKEPCLEVVKLLIEHGAYFRYTDNDKISNNNPLKELILRDADLCTQLLINKFNHQFLPEVYKNPEYVEKLPRIDKLNIWNSQGVGGGIAKCVESEIEAKTFCDVMRVHPTVLTLMCVQALIKPQKTKKKRPTHQGPVKRSARLALLNMDRSVNKKKLICLESHYLCINILCY